MIRDFKNQDCDRVMELWLQTNKTAHPFIEPAYWQKNYGAVKDSISKATVYIYEDNEKVQGFIGLVDECIAGLFVFEEVQSTGIGKQLLDYARNRNTRLTLTVYKKNQRAIDFYLREEFTITCEQVEAHTKELELCMEWVHRV